MRFKSIIAAFAIILSAVIIGGMVFFQTERFGKILTKVVNDLSEKKIKAKVSLKNVEVSLFPPGLELLKVNIKKTIESDKTIDLELGKIGFYISFLELEDKRITLGEVRISDSVIAYDGPESKEELIEIEEGLINNIFNYNQSLPLKLDTLVIENTGLHFNHDLLHIRRAKVIKKKENFVARLNLSNIKPLKDEDHYIDELWVDAIIGKKNLNIQRLKIQHDVHAILLKGKINNYRLLKRAEAKFLGEASLHLANLKHSLSFFEKFEIANGIANINFNFSYKDFLPSGKLDVAINELNSNFVDAEQIITNLSFEDNKIQVTDLNIVKETQNLQLQERVVIYNHVSNKWLPEAIKIKLEKFKN